MMGGVADGCFGVVLGVGASSELLTASCVEIFEESDGRTMEADGGCRTRNSGWRGGRRVAGSA